MHIVRLVGMHMMVSVMRGPPNGSALHGGGTEQAEDELSGA
jgi:hypothetical protein